MVGTVLRAFAHPTAPSWPTISISRSPSGNGPPH